MSPPISLMLAALLLLTPTSTLAKLSLGATALNFGVCASQTVTNSGPTVIRGSLGLTPGSSISGFPPGTATKIEIGSAAAIECKDQAANTYATCVGLPTDVDLSGQPLGGRTLFPGVYNFATTASLDGQLKLDAKSNPDGQFIFKIGTSFSTAASSKAVLKRVAMSFSAWVAAPRLGLIINSWGLSLRIPVCLSLRGPVLLGVYMHSMARSRCWGMISRRRAAVLGLPERTKLRFSSIFSFSFLLSSSTLEEEIMFLLRKGQLYHGMTLKIVCVVRVTPQGTSLLN